MAQSVATVCTGIGVGGRKLLKDKKNQNRPEADSARHSSLSKAAFKAVQSIPQVTKGYNLPDQPSIRARYWGQLLSHGTDCPHSPWMHAHELTRLRTSHPEINCE